MKSIFEQIHRQRVGFIAENRRLMVEAVSIEAIGGAGSNEDDIIDDRYTDLVPEAIDNAEVFMAGSRRFTPLFERSRLLPGQRIEEPAIIIEQTGAVVVESGWKAELNDRPHLILERYLPRPRAEAIGTQVDPVMLEVFNNLFMSIAEQMGATLVNTSHSVNIKERLDFACAVFDNRGDLVANATHVPVHLGSMSESVKTVIRENGASMRPGSVYMLNAPYDGGTHLPDVTVITPVFDEVGRNILFYVSSPVHGVIMPISEVGRRDRRQ